MTKKLLILSVLAISIFSVVGCGSKEDEGGSIVAPKADNTGKSAEKGQNTSTTNVN